MQSALFAFSRKNATICSRSSGTTLRSTISAPSLAEFLSNSTSLGPLLSSSWSVYEESLTSVQNAMMALQQKQQCTTEQNGVATDGVNSMKALGNANPFFHRRTNKRVEVVKRKARSELQKCGWDSVGYAYDDRQLNLISNGSHPDNIERVDASQLSYEEFVERFERPSRPVILTGLTDDWKANQRWTLPLLLRAYRNQKFKCGEDDDGYSVKLKMKYYLHYASTQHDDSPLYIFDSSFADRQKTSKLLEDYEVPLIFRDDLFRYAAERRRPPYRWFVMGPTRSGTAIHIDPLGTSAWNALIQGHKKWCLIHPSAPKQLVKPTKEESGPHSEEAITWFHTVYARVLSTDWPADQYPVIHAVQCPGDVMFVPSGWWHVVMNLDATVAVTQNFCSITNLPKVWPKTVRGRTALASHWLSAMRRQRPELMPYIDAINTANGIPPLNIEEPFDSSSSSSSSNDSASESTDGETQTSNGSSATTMLLAERRKRKCSPPLTGPDVNNSNGTLHHRQQPPYNKRTTSQSQQNAGSVQSSVAVIAGSDCASKMRKSP